MNVLVGRRREENVGFFLNASWCLVFHGRGGGGGRRGGREEFDSPMGEEEDAKLLRKPLDFLA